MFSPASDKDLDIASHGALTYPPLRGEFAANRGKVFKLATEAPVAASYRRLGTPMMVSMFNEAGVFPGGFPTKGNVEHRRELEAENWGDWAKIETDTCPPCPMRCRKRLVIRTGPDAGRELHAPEYETVRLRWILYGAKRQ